MPENDWRKTVRHARCVSLVLLRSFSSRRVRWCRAERQMLCMMMLPLSTSSVAHQSSLSVDAWSAHRLPAWIMQPPDWQTPLNGIISPSSDHYAKTTGGASSNGSADGVAHIDGQLITIIVSNTHALPAEYKCLKSNKTISIHLRMFARFLF